MCDFPQIDSINFTPMPQTHTISKRKACRQQIKNTIKQNKSLLWNSKVSDEV